MRTETARIRVRLTPRAGRTELARIEGGVLYVRVAAPPVDGAANKALVEHLSDILALPKSSIQIESGAASREKRLAVSGIGEAEIWERLNRAAPAGRTPQ